VSLGVALLAAISLLQGQPPREQAVLANVRVALFYSVKKKTVPRTFTNFRIQIARDDVVLLEQAVPPYPGRESYGVEPANYGEKRSIFVRDLDGDGEPEVLLDLYWGGAHCCFWSRVYRYDQAGRYRVSLHFWGNPSYRLRDLNADSKPELVTADDRFAYRFASFAFSGLPVRIWSYAAGRFTDATRRFPKQIAGDAGRQWRLYRGPGLKYHETRGFLAAWAADEYLLGRGKQVDKALRLALRRGDLSGSFPRDPSAFIRQLKRFLRATGYLRR
jgi:hypothetical protein